MSDFRLPRLPRNVAIIDPRTGYPTIIFQRWMQNFADTIETQEGTQDALLAAVVAAQAAADDAQTAADAAQAAAVAADAAADTAQASADGANSVASLTNSGVTPNPLSATDAGANATITIAAHTRIYGDGATLAIAGPSSLTGLAYSTLYYVYYDDATRADTTPTYASTTSVMTAAQTGDRH
ncbi:MAG: hypothetical protein V4696_01965, partial [Pseudomonadota bacterium]